MLHYSPGVAEICFEQSGPNFEYITLQPVHVDGCDSPETAHGFVYVSLRSKRF